jgi:hypothetical protein
VGEGHLLVQEVVAVLGTVAVPVEGVVEVAAEEDVVEEDAEGAVLEVLPYIHFDSLLIICFFIWFLSSN